jgi:hypothetical protein
MADEEKPRQVHVTRPTYMRDRTNDLRIQKDVAQRLIARYLREKMTPGDANDFANRIVDGIVSNMPAAGRPALRGFRMIPEHPPEDLTSKIASAYRSIRPQGKTDWALARDLWEIVYKYGQALPDDVVI